MTDQKRNIISLETRMTNYQRAETEQRFMPLLPVIVRLDGKCFHAYTKDLKVPYDQDFMNIMIELTCYLVDLTSACIGYTQSDEITLVLYQSRLNSRIYFDGRKQKIVSTLSGQASAFFNFLAERILPKSKGEMKILGFSLHRPLASFDCKVWQEPTLEEAVNELLFREFDAIRNSLNSAARMFYSDGELLGKSKGQLHEMLFQKGVNWNNYPPCFKRGTYVQRRINKIRELTQEDLEKIPKKHRPAIGTWVERPKTMVLDMPPFTQIKNQIGVVFNQECPIYSY